MESRSKVSFYVSTSGNDGWSGRLPEPSRDGRDGPFASIECARVAVRSLADRGAPITVQIRGGVYRLQKPVTFAPEDSGKPLAPITYEASPGETPVLSGGVQLTGRVETRVNGKIAWETKAPSWVFHQIWANGERRYRPRLPRQGYYKVKATPPPPDFYHGSSQFTAEPHEAKDWKNLDDVEIVALTPWVESRMPIASVDELTIHHKTWDEWRGEGYDACSRIADPRFADPERGDFRLPADSPALDLGFVPFDLSQVGPRKPYGAGHRNP